MAREPQQGTFRGFGDQAMRRHRVTPPAPTPTSPAPAASTPAHQAGLFQEAEVRYPGAPAGTFNAAQFRNVQRGIPGAPDPPRRPAAPSESSAPATPARSAWTQPQLPVPDNTPAAPTPSQGASRERSVNAASYISHSQLGVGHEQRATPPSAASPRAAAPSRPTAAPTASTPESAATPAPGSGWATAAKATRAVSAATGLVRVLGKAPAPPAVKAQRSTGGWTT